MKRLAIYLLAVALLTLAGFGQWGLRRLRTASAPVLAEGAFAALGGLRSLVAEIVWFRADRLQEEGRYVEMAQLADTLTFMEPHTPEVWSYAAWNLSYNISVMMGTEEDRWRWVYAGIRLLRDRGLKLNPQSRELMRELAWMFELKLGIDIDSAAAFYRKRWRGIIEDVRTRGAWEELGMDVRKMAVIEQRTGFNDWTDPLLSAVYWGIEGGCPDIVEQSSVIYRRRH